MRAATNLTQNDL